MKKTKIVGNLGLNKINLKSPSYYKNLQFGNNGQIKSPLVRPKCVVDNKIWVLEGSQKKVLKTKRVYNHYLGKIKIFETIDWSTL